MEIQQASFERPGQRTWHGPRFEIDDGAAPAEWPGIGRVLSTLTLATLFVVGGLGFLHKVLPQMIEAEVAKQAKAKKAAGKKDHSGDSDKTARGLAGAPPKPAGAPDATEEAEVARAAEEAMRRFLEHQRQRAEDGLNAAEEELERRRAEQWRRHEEFIERHRRWHDGIGGGFRGFPAPGEAWGKGPPARSAPQVRIKELRD